MNIKEAKIRLRQETIQKLKEQHQTERNSKSKIISNKVLLSRDFKRAQAVMEYLHKQYRIPLHRMEVISYGSGQPIADNATRDGRALNRRVVILVFE